MGVVCKDGVIIGGEKLVASKLMAKSSDKRVYNVDSHVGMVNLSLVSLNLLGYWRKNPRF